MNRSYNPVTIYTTHPLYTYGEFTNLVGYNNDYYGGVSSLLIDGQAQSNCWSGFMSEVSEFAKTYNDNFIVICRDFHMEMNFVYIFTSDGKIYYEELSKFILRYMKHYDVCPSYFIDKSDECLSHYFYNNEQNILKFIENNVDNYI